MDLHDIVMIVVAIVGLTLNIIVIPVRVTNKINDMFNQMKTWVQEGLDALRRDMKVDLKEIHSRLLDVEKEQARLCGENDAILKLGGISSIVKIAGAAKGLRHDAGNEGP